MHQRWALRAGLSAEELQAIELSELATLDDRSRAAVEAVARLMALANLSANTAEAIFASLAAARTRRVRRAPHT